MVPLGEHNLPGLPRWSGLRVPSTPHNLPYLCLGDTALEHLLERMVRNFQHPQDYTAYFWSRRRAMTSFWISLVPSPMIMSGASR